MAERGAACLRGRQVGCAGDLTEAVGSGVRASKVVPAGRSDAPDTGGRTGRPRRTSWYRLAISPEPAVLLSAGYRGSTAAWLKRPAYRDASPLGETYGICEIAERQTVVASVLARVTAIGGPFGDDITPGSVQSAAGSTMFRSRSTSPPRPFLPLPPAVRIQYRPPKWVRVRRSHPGPRLAALPVAHVPLFRGHHHRQERIDERKVRKWLTGSTSGSAHISFG